MAELSFTPNLARHVDTPAESLHGETVREVLDAYFGKHPLVKGYVLDDQGALRKHVAIYVNDALIRDRVQQSDAIRVSDRVYVFQALSGG